MYMRAAEMREFTYMLSALNHMLMVLLLSAFSCAERDFNFNESQVPLLEPKEEPIHQLYHIRDAYAMEMARCQNNSSDILLTVVLKNHDWADLSEEKKAKIIEKLSSFFAIPQDFIATKSASTEYLIEMQKTAIHKGRNKCDRARSLGVVSFMIGCGHSYFAMGAPIAKQINAQIRDGSLDNIAEEKFGWWIIWRAPSKARAHRARRHSEGSGIDVEDYDDDYEYGDEEDDNIEIATEMPIATTHAHRHHHAVEELDRADNKLDTTTYDRTLVEADNGDIKEDSGILLLKKPSHGIIDEEIFKSVSQLESVISKTIENTKNIKELATIVEVHDNLSTLDMTPVAEIEKKLETSNSFDVTEHKSLQQTTTINNSHDHMEQNLISLAKSIGSTTPKAREADDSDKASDMSPNLHELVTISDDSHDELTSISTSTFLAITAISMTMPPRQSTNRTAQIATTFATFLSGQPNNSTFNGPLFSSPSLPKTLFLPTTTTFMSPSLNPLLPKKTQPKEEKIRTFNNFVTFNNADGAFSSVTTIPPTSTQSSSDLKSWTTRKSNADYGNRSAESTVLVYDTEFVTNIDDHINKKNGFNEETEEAQDVSAEQQKKMVTANKETGPITIPPLQSIKEENYTLNGVSTSTIAAATTASTVSATTLLQMKETTSSDVSTFSSTEIAEPKLVNLVPMIKTRLKKIAVTSGKFFTMRIPEDTFYDNEDNSNLRLELTENDGRELKPTSWIQFNKDNREIYGVPIDDTVSKYSYILSATDTGNKSVTETVEIAVQQHHSVRSVNHEIHITVNINDTHMHSIDWEIKLIKAISTTLADKTTNAIVVREIRPIPQEPNAFVFVYFNETLSTSVCPKSELHNLVMRLDVNQLHNLVGLTLSIKSISGQLIGTCANLNGSKPKSTIHLNKNLPPIPRNQVDQVNATVGHLLVYKVLSDTFYDPNDNELLLTLKTKEHKDLSPSHWLQFDSKNHEFYGIPKSSDIGTEQYMLVAKDTGGLSATDALVVVVSHAPKKEFSVFFKAYLAIRHELFNADMQRKFVERIAYLFGDQSTQNVQIRSVTTHHDSDGTIVNFYNTSLFKLNNRCPEEQIEKTRSVYLLQDHVLRDRVKKILGLELNITNVQVIPFGSCYPQIDISHREFIPPKADQPSQKSTFTENYLYTFILPAVIIIAMLLIAAIIACCLHRRQRKCGKMEIGNEEERKSFRTKGIPVIFQDELDEKPEIGNKSPIILKDEKPPLLPPSYNTSNTNGDNDLDEYVPPPAVVVGGRDVRGKSPATPSYRKPPPYVSP